MDLQIHVESWMVPQSTSFCCQDHISVAHTCAAFVSCNHFPWFFGRLDRCQLFRSAQRVYMQYDMPIFLPIPIPESLFLFSLKWRKLREEEKLNLSSYFSPFPSWSNGRGDAAINCTLRKSIMLGFFISSINWCNSATLMAASYSSSICPPNASCMPVM